LKAPTTDHEGPAITYMVKHAKVFEEVRMAAAGLETIGRRSWLNDAWLKQLAKMQNADGTSGKGDGLPRDTGSVVAAVLRLGGTIDKPDTVRKALDAGQRKDGGF